MSYAGSSSSAAEPSLCGRDRPELANSFRHIVVGYRQRSANPSSLPAHAANFATTFPPPHCDHNPERRASLRRGSGNHEKALLIYHTRSATGERRFAVVVATHWQRKTNSLRMTSVRIRSGGREPAVGVETR